jgi:polysaccharide export outer membrane protein
MQVHAEESQGMRTVLVVLLLLAACGPKSYDGFPYNREPDPRNHEISLGVGDIVDINVWDQKDLNTEATIRPDGTITMPLVGDLKAVGLTPTQLRDQIKTKLANYVKLSGAGNEVTVAVKTWNSYRFTVNGEVSRPGVYTSTNWLQVSDAIALAGGPTRFGDRDSIVLLRKDATGKSHSIPLNFDLLASGKRPDMNVWVLPDDVIWVP